MAKTDFENGTVVTPEYLDSMFRTNGGHRHDGADDDGHCNQISLVNEVAGVLPAANIGSHYHPNELLMARDIHGYAEGFQNIAISGYVNAFNVLVRWSSQMIYIGVTNYVKIINLTFPYFSALTGGVDSPIASTTPLPVDIRPESTSEHQISILNADSRSFGTVQVQPDGLVVFNRTYVAGTMLLTNNSQFTAGGNNGWFPFVVQYPVFVAM
jgi:hypothetical protein